MRSTCRLLSLLAWCYYINPPVRHSTCVLVVCGPALRSDWQLRFRFICSATVLAAVAEKPLPSHPILALQHFPALPVAPAGPTGEPVAGVSELCMHWLTDWLTACWAAWFGLSRVALAEPSSGATFSPQSTTTSTTTWPPNPPLHCVSRSALWLWGVTCLFCAVIAAIAAHINQLWKNWKKKINKM